MGLQKLTLAAALALGAVGSAFKAEVAQSIAAGTPYVLPAGLWMVAAVTNGKVQYSTDGGTTWRDLNAVSAGAPLVYSDGYCVQVISTSGTITQYLVQIA